MVHGVHVFARRLHFGDFAATDHDSFAEGEGGTRKVRDLRVSLETLVEGSISERWLVVAVVAWVLIWGSALARLEEDLGLSESRRCPWSRPSVLG